MAASKDILFWKMCAAGNDFVVIDNRAQIVHGDAPVCAQKVCKRHISVGADGLLLIEPSKKASFKMRYFNADGTEGEMCGNGARCAARYAFLTGIAGNTMDIETVSGTVGAEILEPLVRIRMNPVTKKELHKKVCGIYMHYLEQGTPGLPHAVVFKEDLTMEEDIEEVGRKIRNFEGFLKGANVNFCRIIKNIKNTIMNRTYERGVERETLSCGTGAASVACVAYLLGRCGNEVDVRTRGGVLKVEISGDDLESIYLTGDARVVYTGTLADGEHYYQQQEVVQ